MSFEPPPQNPVPPQRPSSDRILDGEIVDLNGPRNGPGSQRNGEPNELYNPKGFKDIYEEAKWLRKLSGKAAIAFMMTFMVLWGAGSYAEVVELRRMNPELFAIPEGPAPDSPASESTPSDSASTEIAVDEEIATRADTASTVNGSDTSSTPVAPTFLERFGLKLLAAFGSIGFFIFASAAVSEISFRAYEGREMESYEVLDSLTKSHGVKLLLLGSFFLVLLLTVGTVSIISTTEGADLGWSGLAVALFLLQSYIQLRTMFSVQSLIGEDLSPIEAIARSWQITKGNFFRLLWWTIAFGFIFVLTSFFVFLLPMIIVGSIIGAIFSWAAPVINIVVLFVALALAVKHFSLIFYFQMALYRELRLRNDGLDVAQNDSMLGANMS